MTKSVIPPSTDEYLQLSTDVYPDEYNLSGDLSSGTSFTLPDGYMVIKTSSVEQLADGFAAVAVEDPNGNIIIVNEGTWPGLTPFDRSTVFADYQISKGFTPSALTDAAEFAQQIEQLESTQLDETNVPIYVTGHSLGGIEAQKEAQKLVSLSPSDFAAGATFGATGLPGQTAAGGPKKLIDYVDYGDLVGNYAKDTQTQTTNPFASQPSAFYHYGVVKEVGSPSNAIDLQSAELDNNYTLALNSLAPGGNLDDFFEIKTIIDLSYAFKYHKISNYASDIAKMETVPESIAGLPSLDQIAEDITLAYGNSAASNAGDETLEGNGSIETPYFTASYNSTTDQFTIDQTGNINTSDGTAASGGVTAITLNPTTDLAASASYTSEDGSVYNWKMNANGNIQTLTVNESTGDSYRINYTYSKNTITGVLTNGYLGANLSGALQFTQTTQIGSGGQISSQISGVAADISLDNANITLASNANVSITGNNNTIAAGANAVLALSGTGNTITLAPGASISGDLSTDTVTFMTAWGDQITFDPGAYYSLQGSASPTVSASLMGPSNLALGTLSVNPGTGADSVALTDGLIVPLSGVTNDVLAAAPATDTPAEALLAYLSDLGDSTSLAGLDALNFAYLNPAATPYAVQPSQVTPIDNDTAADVYYVADGVAGAVFAGQGQATIVVNGQDQQVTAYNILNADNANLAQDSISDMQELESYGAGTVTLTQAQWTGFSLIGGTADLVLAGGGLFDLDSPEVQAGAQFASLTAQGWTGTTLVGNGTNGQTLTASLYGNDTLTAGDGTGDVLVAGEGVDTLTGGTGGDTFVCPDGLAAGSTVTGNGGGNTLQLNGDITLTASNDNVTAAMPLRHAG